MEPTEAGVAGWVVGALYGLALAWLCRGRRFGPADWVTLTRAALAGCVTALVAQSLFGADWRVPLVVLTTVALILDAVDGQVARRTRTVSEFGARFDMEVDAFLILVLSVYVAPVAGWWVLSIGAMRYVYVAVSWFLPWMHRRLFPRYWRKVVAAIQGIVLLTAASGMVASPVMRALILAALALLAESFGRDVVWLWRRRHEPPQEPLPEPGVDVAGAAQRSEAFK